MRCHIRHDIRQSLNTVTDEKTTFHRRDTTLSRRVPISGDDHSVLPTHHPRRIHRRGITRERKDEKRGRLYRSYSQLPDKRQHHHEPTAFYTEKNTFWSPRVRRTQTVLRRYGTKM